MESEEIESRQQTFLTVIDNFIFEPHRLVVGGINIWRSSDSSERTNKAQFEIDAIYRFVPFFHLFLEETNAGLQETAICFHLKASSYTNSGVFSLRYTL
jgi:hypothetical protein